MHTKFVKHDRGQKQRANEAARRGMEGRRRLGDRLTVPAGELLAHCFDDLEAARDLLQHGCSRAAVASLKQNPKIVKERQP
jgi:hypothetical protein